jgi:hypothetical protein
MLGEDTLADAILDRIVHDSYALLIKGKFSMHERKNITARAQQPMTVIPLPSEW